MSNPFRVPGPVIVNVSGGRSSGYMMHSILNAYDGKPPSDMAFVFANTGREMPQTLDFVRDMQEHWGQLIRWVEYTADPDPTQRWQEVSYETASRHGEPYWELIVREKFLPNVRYRFCTKELKINAIRRWAVVNGLKNADRVVGIRADEPRRAARMRANDDVYIPLVTAGVTKEDVIEFWKGQPFDLHLPSIDGRAVLSNCDLCFLKSTDILVGTIRHNPGIETWWLAAEQMIGKTFHSRKRIGFKEMAVRAGRPVPRLVAEIEHPEESIDCFCGDDI